MTSVDKTYDQGLKDGYSIAKAERLFTRQNDRVIMQMIVDMFNTDEIAAKIGYTRRGVHAVTDRLRDKAKCQTLVQLVVFCIKHKLIEI